MRRPALARTLVGALLALLFSGACGTAGDERPPAELRVLVTLEGLRVDRLGLVAATPDGESAAAGASDPAPALTALARAGRVADGLVTSSTEPPAAVATVLTGLPAGEHGYVGPAHPLRDRLPAHLATRAAELSSRGFRAVAFVVGLPADAGLEQGFAEFAAVADAGAAVAALEERLARHAPDDPPLFAWLHLRVDPDDAVRSPAWGRFARQELGPFAAEDPELGRRLAQPEEVAAYLGRRRGTPAWRALQRVRHDAALAAVDAALEPVLARRGVARILVLSVGGAAVDATGDDPALAPFGAGRLRSLALLSGGERRPGARADAHALVSLVDASRLLVEDRWPAPVASVRVATEVAGELCLVTPTARWIRTGGAPVCGLAREDDTRLAEAPPEDVARALAPPVVRAELLHLPERAPAPGAEGASLELRVVGRPPTVARTEDGRLALELDDLDAPLVLDLRLPAGAGEADVLLDDAGHLDRVPLPRLPARDGATWEDAADGQPTWLVDVTPSVGGRVRVRVLSAEMALLRVVISPAPVPAHDWAPRSHGARPAEAWLGVAPGEAVLRGAGLDVSFATAGTTPALVVELAGSVVASEAMRWSGRRFHGRSRRYLLTAGVRSRLAERRNRLAPLPPDAPAGEDGARYRLAFSWPPTAPLPAPRLPAPLLLTHVPPSD